MHWNDKAIILSSRKFGETSAILRVFSPQHGVFAGVVKGASSKNNRGIVQAGNLVNAAWQARLSEQLGIFKLELITPYAAWIMADAGKLAALTAACTLIESGLPERHPYAKLYTQVQTFLDSLHEGNGWQESYVHLELALLAESGFGLDLRSCAATGQTDDLTYISPKSGRAVSRDAGAPYHDKLLPLPAFLLTYPATRNPHPAPQQTLAGLRLTGYFLEHWLLAPHYRKLPAARGRLIELLSVMEPHAA